MCAPRNAGASAVRMTVFVQPEETNSMDKEPTTAPALPADDDVRMAFLAPRVAAELGISVAEAEAQIREVCEAVGWAITNDVGHA